ncbi:vitamin K epoxide reductase family protein [Boudabousia marimammalium]|uniref:Vitamin K epoxide reductase domain-containing protein n=1 Tax=Boudabousia marimammalium TaxID=156892 RepID=A0A1Q5PRJ8_9ACTO|nr:vitamin K epoxide reductase family protein [Boudabousia marimammalium]OKL50143.1 hypothetical protein BM477_01720 [Boudabousia marimammalium]
MAEDNDFYSASPNRSEPAPELAIAPEESDEQMDTSLGETTAEDNEPAEETTVLGGITDQEFAAEAKRRTDPSEKETAGGLDAIPAWLMVLFSALGLTASVALVLATIEHAKNPEAQLSCDLNAYVSCGASLSSWKSEVFFGFPNALLGTVAFAALLTVSVLLVSNVKLPRWFWMAMTVASTLALLFVYWFAWQSAFSMQKLCPWCMVIWFSMIALFIIIVGRASRAQIPGLGWLGRVMVRDWWGFSAVMYGLLVLIVILGLGSKLFS